MQESNIEIELKYENYNKIKFVFFVPLQKFWIWISILE